MSSDVYKCVMNPDKAHIILSDLLSTPDINYKSIDRVELTKLPYVSSMDDIETGVIGNPPSCEIPPNVCIATIYFK